MRRSRLPLTEADYKIIRENYLTLTDEQTAALLERSKSAIANIRRKMGLFTPGIGGRYSKEEVIFIRENYQSMSDEELAEKLKRTLNGIVHIRSRIKLKRHRPQPEKRYHTDKKILKMKSLIYLCENTESLYMLEKYKTELKKLSGL